MIYRFIALITLLFLLIASPALAACSYTGNIYHGAWASGITMAPAPFTPSVANATLAVFVMVAGINTSYEYSSIGDDQSGAYTPVDTVQALSVSASAELRTFYVKNPTVASTTTTVTFADANVLYADIFIVEWSGCHTTAPLDGHAVSDPPQNNPGTSTSIVTSGNATTTANGNGLSGFTFTPRTGTINLTTGTSGDGTTLTSRFSRAGTPTATMVVTGSQTTASATTSARFTPDYSDVVTDWFSAVMAFKPAAASTRVRPRVIQ